MADDKDKKAEKVEEEVYGLDDEPPKKASLIDRFKPYLIPAGSAFGAFVLAAVLFLFVFNGDNDKPAGEETSSTETVEVSHETAAGETVSDEHQKKAIPPDNIAHKETTGGKTDSVSSGFTKKDVDILEIDTAAIMKELDFLFWTPEMENSAEELGMTPKDSSDTLNWIEKQMDSLNRRRVEIDSRERQLKALEYTVGQSLVKLDQAESARIIKLARLYDGMKPDEVAKLFANLPDSIVTAILPRMKPANASKILAMMPPKRAAKLSTQLITVKVD
nr:hypothetical protein [candidate division Zixibacteria bacterium]